MAPLWYSWYFAKYSEEALHTVIRWAIYGKPIVSLWLMLSLNQYSVQCCALHNVVSKLLEWYAVRQMHWAKGKQLSGFFFHISKVGNNLSRTLVLFSIMTDALVFEIMMVQNSVWIVIYFINLWMSKYQRHFFQLCRYFCAAGRHNIEDIVQSGTLCWYITDCWRYYKDRETPL